MDHMAGANICSNWSQSLYGLRKMIEALEDINKCTGANLLWSVLHEHHYRDDDLVWVKKYCSSNLAGKPTELLAIAICDSLLAIPMEQRMMVLYDYPHFILAKYGYCARRGGCTECIYHKTREERIEKEEKARYEQKLSNEAGISGEN